MSNETTDQTAVRLADRSPVVLREVVAPDGTVYTVYTDGHWDRTCWDGSFVGDDSDSSTTPAEVLLAYGPGGVAAALAASRA